MFKLFSIFVFLIFGVNAKSIDDAMDEVLSSKQEPCVFKKDVHFRVINKIEGTSEILVLATGKEVEYSNISISVSKCCQKGDENYGFFSVSNSKQKKRIFKGWLFSKHSSMNSVEDPKFDILLLKCV